MMKVLNFAQFIPIEGLPLENDITLKIYSDLSKGYDVQCEFVKPVGQNPKWIALLRDSSKIRREIFSQTNYFDKAYNIKIHFYRGSFPYLNRLPFHTRWIYPFEFKYYGRFLAEIINNFQPKILHAHSLFKDGYYALELHKKYSIPYILTLRGASTQIYKTNLGKEILQNAASITTPDFSLWSELKQGYDINLIPHGIEDSWFGKKEKEFNSESLRLVTVSRLLKMKNIQVVLKAIARLIHIGYDIRYDIIGDGDYRSNLETLTKELNLMNIVKFHGFQSKEYIKNIYWDADVFVMLSYPETFGRSYFEAAAQGLYIIGVKNTGAYGHLTEREASFISIDEDELVQSLKKIDIQEFESKTAKMRTVVMNMRNSNIIESYYRIISNNI